MGRKTKEFDYYIFIDYSENLIGYNIIEKDKIEHVLPKTIRFRHYKGSPNRKIYLKHLKHTLKRNNIKSYFKKIRIKEIRNKIDIFVEVLEFIKKHDNCVFFVSIDDYQYKTFMKMVKLTDGNKTQIIRESQLKQGSVEYKLSLIIDNLLNIERRKQK